MADESEEFEFRLILERESRSGGSPREPEKYDPTSGMSGTQKFLAGAGKAFVDLGRGAKQLVGMGNQEDIDESKRLDAPLMSTGAGKAGNVAGNIAATLPAAAIPGVNTAVGAAALGGATGALQPTATGESRLANTALGAASGVAGKYVGDAAAKGFGFIADSLGRIRPAAQASEAGEVMAKGYKLPPSYARLAGAKPSALDDMLESFGGKIKTEQAFSAANQGNTNRLVRKALGLGEGDKVTAEELQGVRDVAGETYEAVKQFKGRFKSDQEFETALGRIVRDRTPVSTKARGEILKAPQQVSDLIEKLRGDYNPEEAIEVVKKLRNDGRLESKSLDANTRALGRAKLQASQEVDNLIERNLSRDKDAAGLFKAYKQARTLIARSYDVEKALNKGTGNVSAVKLARGADKRPVGGELSDVVDFARKYGGAARTVEERGSRAGPSHSPLDVAAATVAGMHHPLAAAALLSRPVARRYLLSNMGQKSMLPSAAQTLEQKALPRAGEIIAPQLLPAYRSQE